MQNNVKRRILINPINVVKKISVIIVKRKIKIEWVGKKDCSTTIDLHSEQMTFTKPVFYV
jgi:hypothetical protein